MNIAFLRMWCKVEVGDTITILRSKSMQLMIYTITDGDW